MLTKESALAMFLTSIAALSGCGRIGFEPLSNDNSIRNSESSDELSDVAIDVVGELGGVATIPRNIDLYVDATIPDPNQDDDVISNADSATDASIEEDSADSAADTAVDSATDAGADTTVDSATDAGADTTVDSATDSEIPDTAVPDSSDGAQVTDSAAEDTGTACGGTIVFGLCWYLTAIGASCDQHCQSHGGYDTNTPKYVGTPSEGGSLDQCSQILTALGQPQNVSEGMNIYGYGCHVWENSDAWWLRSPDFNPTFSGAPARIACACIQ